MTVTLDKPAGMIGEKVNRSVTKSIRMTAKEAEELSRLSRLLSKPNDAALLYEAYSRGMKAIKLDEAVNEYTKRERSLGEVAELFAISSADLARELVKRNIPTLEVSIDQAKANLDHLIRRHFS
ncbi:MAG TPA: hypothetical protein GXZ82_10835 [Firmicutes bacterium]|jgi:predicted HTH domain antitoxin|nr:hypothetical protein [Bacillota bacterium]